MWHASSRVVSVPSVTWRMAKGRQPLRLVNRALLLSLTILFFATWQPSPLYATPRGQSGVSSTVYVLTFAGPVTPVLESYLNQAISDAQATDAAAIILQLDTPGGSVEVTHSIIQTMLASPIPLVVYVAPAGARAGSAGTFITLAGHVAAMAPNTSIGAASPVDQNGGDIDETLAAKITNILSADIENLATRRGDEATAWAIAAVQEAAAATASQALELGVIDLIAPDLGTLVNQLEGFTVTLADGPRVLHVADARLVMQEMTPMQRALNLLVDPSLVTILLSLGVIALVVEIRTPGLGVSGILGVIALLLAFYGLGQLDANLTGLILMGIAIVLFVAEAFTPTFHLLTVGGVIAFLLGGALLFDAPGITTPWLTLVLLAAAMGVLAVVASYLALRAQSRPVLTGTEGLIGITGITKSAFAAGETGSVFVHGEWWNARLASGQIAANMPVRVLDRQGMTLIVVPSQDSSVDPSVALPQLTPTHEKK